MTRSLTDGVPSRCLSFTVSSSLGHFRRIDRSGTKQTYRIIPRTTVAGIAAALAGWDRDSYYDAFSPENSAISIEVTGGVRTITQSRYELGTNPDGDMDGYGGTGRKTLRVKYPDGERPRQIRSYEFVVDPAYRINLAMTDHDRYQELKQKLEAGLSYYPVSMGKSEYLARIEYHGELTSKPVTNEDSVHVDSAVPSGDANVVPSSETIYRERVPGYMTANSHGRQTTGFVDYSFTAKGQMTLHSVPTGCARVADRTVIFC